MDENRQIRLLIPPFFFFGVLLLGGIEDHEDDLTMIKDLGTERLLVAAAIIGAATLPVGHIISSINYAILGLLQRFGYVRIVAPLSEQSARNVWEMLKSSRGFNNTSQDLYLAAVTLDHELLPERIHAWVMRSWSAFIISINSCIALVLGHLCLLLLSVFNDTWPLIAGSLVVGIVLLLNAYIAWWRTKIMLDFQAERNLTTDRSNK